jgi:hypothetical protein
MHQPAFDYSRTYAEMSDNELLAIAGDSTSLTREALAALQAEIEKRHLRKGPQAEDQRLATDNYWAWRARLGPKLNSPRMTFLLPPWQSAEADEDLRILLGNQVVGGWIAVFASQFIIGGLFGGLYYLWVTVRLAPLQSSSHLSQVLAVRRYRNAASLNGLFGVSSPILQHSKLVCGNCGDVSLTASHGGDRRKLVKQIIALHETSNLDSFTTNTVIANTENGPHTFFRLRQSIGNSFSRKSYTS